MPIKNNFKPASVFAVVLCGLATLSATAIGAPQSNGVILLQPQTGTKPVSYTHLTLPTKA